ncbi:MAG: CBU_0592 family membrane protein [Longimicrobiales bacterium]
MLDQLISLVGASLVLLAYFANNRGWLGPWDRSYHLMNLVGGLLLLWVAVVDRRAGFMVLELTWAVIAIPPLLQPRGNPPH